MKTVSTLSILGMLYSSMLYANVEDPKDLGLSDNIVKMELAGNRIKQFPFFEYVKAINKNQKLTMAMDTKKYPELIGKKVDIYLSNPIGTLIDIRDIRLKDVREASGPTEYVFKKGGVRKNTIKLANKNSLKYTHYKTRTKSNTGLGHGYDIVIDMNRNGLLDNGDIVDGASTEAGIYMVGDTSRRGPLEIKKYKYVLSQGIAKSYQLPAELNATVDEWGFEDSAVNATHQVLYYPKNIDSIKSLPLVVISHGAGHEYDWYDYIGKHLASYGYLVMSHDNGPTINSPRTLTLHHIEGMLDSLDSIDKGKLKGKIDLHKITLIGHSFGAKGVAEAYNTLKTGKIYTRYGLSKRDDAAEIAALLEASSEGSMYEYTEDGGFLIENFVSKHGIKAEDIRLVDSMAPSPGSVKGGAVPAEVNFHEWIGLGDSLIKNSADDVLTQSHHLYDRATGWRMLTSLYGAGHAWFHGGKEINPNTGENVAWIFNGDKACDINEKITHKVVLGMMLPMIKHFNEDNVPATDFMYRDYAKFHAIGVDRVKNECMILSNEYMKVADNSSDILMVDNYEDSQSLNQASSGAKVEYKNLEVNEGELQDSDGTYTNTDNSDLFNGTLWSSEAYKNNGLALAWSEKSFYRWVLPEEKRDLSKHAYLEMNVAQIPGHTYNDENKNLSFKVLLHDSKGHKQAINILASSNGIPKAYDKEKAILFTGDSDDFGDLDENTNLDDLFGTDTTSTDTSETNDSEHKIPKINSELVTSIANFKRIRIRLSDFTANGSKVNLSDIKMITLKFGTKNSSSMGAIMIDDVAFIKADKKADKEVSIDNISPAEELDQDDMLSNIHEFTVESGEVTSGSCKILKDTVVYADGYTEDDVIGGILYSENLEPYAFLSDTSFTSKVEMLPIVCVKMSNNGPEEFLLTGKQRPQLIKK